MSNTANGNPSITYTLERSIVTALNVDIPTNSKRMIPKKLNIHKTGIVIRKFGRTVFLNSFVKVLTKNLNIWKLS
jgi:hypothetical protein